MLYMKYSTAGHVKDTKALSSPNVWLSFKFVVPRFLLVKCCASLNFPVS